MRHCHVLNCQVRHFHCPRTEQNLIVRIGKPEAKVTIMKDCILDIVLLMLTTDRHKASRGLSATAELRLVCFALPGICFTVDLGLM